MARKRTLRNRNRQASKTTLLIVGEGPDDQAFIKHMDQQFRADNTGVKPTIEKQSGGSPGNIITNAARKYEHRSFDLRFFLLDSDIPISQQDYDKARKYGYRIILWAPVCLEGALLDVLGENVDGIDLATALKRRLHPLLNGPHTDCKSYAQLFPKTLLEKTSNESVTSVKTALVNEPN
ncbi:MAG: hypothetical protein MH219_03285 [Marinobacter sp.]|jgi:hypothetical protein|nr:hypothetical protein [Marinobacter sp. M3C]MCL1476646.1 hypothetical protein [Marinobacter sp.]MCL1485436.1 hypothetical protein [Marinobacter sp.]MCL1487968.1 hypothetical protein [Marinobacter sp.]